MLRYIVVIGNPANAADARCIDDVRRRLKDSPTGWRSAVDRPGFYAAQIDQAAFTDSPMLLHDDRGVVFGRIYTTPDSFGACSSKPLRSISRDHSNDIVQSMGRSLISRYWGYYVAAIHYPERSAGLVIRSPVSPLACLHMRLGSLNVFVSHLADCARLRLTTLSVNWDSVTAQVVGGDYLSHETAINEIEAVEGGESIECTPDGCLKHVYWSPHHFLKNRSLSAFPDATHAIRSTVDYCVGALSSEHSHILVNLSGGLDSSIILSALRRAPHRPLLTAVNYYSPRCGDERRYARLMARKVGCRLVESTRNDRLDLRRFHDCNLTVRPVLNFSAPDVEARTSALARESNASAIFDGELGDNIFGSHPSPGVLVECLRNSGIGPSLLAVAVDYAMLTKQSIWRALSLMLSERTHAREGRSFDALQKLRERYGMEGARSLFLASADAEQHHASMGDRFAHPWLILLGQI